MAMVMRVAASLLSPFANSETDVDTVLGHSLFEFTSPDRDRLEAARTAWRQEKQQTAEHSRKFRLPIIPKSAVEPESPASAVQDKPVRLFDESEQIGWALSIDGKQPLVVVKHIQGKDSESVMKSGKSLFSWLGQQGKVDNFCRYGANVTALDGWPEEVRDMVRNENTVLVQVPIKIGGQSGVISALAVSASQDWRYRCAGLAAFLTAAAAGFKRQMMSSTDVDNQTGVKGVRNVLDVSDQLLRNLQNVDRDVVIPIVLPKLQAIGSDAGSASKCD